MERAARPAWSRIFSWAWRDGLGWDESYEAVRWCFLRAMGLSYLFAFFSLAWQVGVLFSSRGLSPSARYLEAVAGQIPVAPIRWQEVPTLFWINSSDGFLSACAWLGVILSLLVVLNIGSRIFLPLLWIIYLSFVSVGVPFLQYQWDALILETGFLAILFALTKQPSLLFLWLLRWLCFRLMFLNGVVKIMAVDRDYLDGTTSTWWEGTALSYHYFTQPLPSWPAWFFHHLPGGWHAASTYGVLAVELVLPFAIFLGRWPRLVAAVIFAGLHATIWLAGSQAFYNLLGIALVLPLLDDRWLTSFSRWLGLNWLARRDTAIWACAATLAAYWWRGLDLRWSGGWSQSVEARQASIAGQSIAFTLLLALSTLVTAQRQGWYAPPDWLQVMLRDARPFYLASTYGAFSNMTRARPEIILEGSNDGITWQEYGLHYKPGELDRAPGWAAPYQPRVDWQLWFAALGAPSPWLPVLWQGMLQGKSEMLSVFRHNPFPEQPPKYLRAVRYAYEFTDWDEGWESGHWWRRVQDRSTPPITLDANGNPVVAPL